MDFLNLINLEFLFNQLPIISGIGFVPYLYNIAKSLAKMLSPLLGTINNSLINNYGDLLNKINNLNIENQSLNSPNINSSYPCKYSSRDTQEKKKRVRNVTTLFIYIGCCIQLF